MTIELFLQIMLKYGIPAAEAAVDLFYKKNPTKEDWKAYFAMVKPYDAYVPPVKT